MKFIEWSERTRIYSLLLIKKRITLLEKATETTCWTDINEKVIASGSLRYSKINKMCTLKLHKNSES